MLLILMPTETSSAIESSASPGGTLSEAVFVARGVTKVYHMGEVDVHALRGIDLELHESEFTVLLGPSGSGKSTLLNILGGLDHPTSGQVFFRGQRAHGRSTSDGELTQVPPPTMSASCSSSTT